MKKYNVTILAKEPIVLRTQSGSEVKSEAFDYIQGSKILGLVAQYNYAQLKETNPDAVYELFHSGNVYYGNAYPSYDSQVGFPVPLSLHKVVDEEGVSKLTFSTITEQKKKQQKEGFVITKGNMLSLFNVPQGERLKSARDLTNRRSKDESMYLYPFIKKGVQFQSSITISESSQEIEQAIQTLNGTHFIGTSKGEFGQIQITIAEETVIAKPSISDTEQLTIYAFSDLVFLNSFGTYSGAIDPKLFGITNGTLDMASSYIKFKSFHTYNSKRRNDDADRLAITKGSILVFKKNSDEQPVEISAEAINEGIGLHKVEGFGQILVNPSFLESTDIEEYESDIRVTDKETPIDLNNELNAILTGRHKVIEKDRNNYKETERFIKENYNLFKSTSKSQWGAIRSYVLESIASEKPQEILDQKLFDDDTGYLREKIDANWNTKQTGKIKEVLEKENCVDLLLKISVELPKTLKND